MPGGILPETFCLGQEPERPGDAVMARSPLQRLCDVECLLVPHGGHAGSVGGVMSHLLGTRERFQPVVVSQPSARFLKVDSAAARVFDASRAGSISVEARHLGVMGRRS